MNSLLLYFYAIICVFVPSTRFFGLKRWLLRLAGAKIEEGVRCASSTRFQLQGDLTIGADTWIGHDVLVVGGDASISVGKYCDIAPRVTIATGTHRVDPTGLRVAGDGYSLPVQIGDGCWIGTGAILLGGTIIGANSVIAAGAVVKGEFPARTLIGGVPARVIRSVDELHAHDGRA